MSHPTGGVHRICEDCWLDYNDVRPPREADFELAICCFCGNKRNIDILVRAQRRPDYCKEGE